MTNQILGVEILPVSPWMILPFALLLLAIAVAPFLQRRWWEKYYPYVSIGLGLLVCIYYVFFLDYHRMIDTLGEYFSFIVLIGSLFVAASGIYLHTERRATPLVNMILLAFGAVISNLLGTTGASMLLIRPFLRINRSRIRGYHVVFFIFIVSNIGGALTPIGDPPLFLGYLNGVPFLWTLHRMWPIWLIAMIPVLAVFFLVDTWSYRKWTKGQPRHDRPARIELRGMRNLFFLMIILAAVFAKTPIREILMIAGAAASHRFASKTALRANEFTWAPIKEVGILFAGIFATMVPALDWLAMNAGRMPIRTPGQYYWASGILSSFLDNAPTYINFLSAAMGQHHLTLANPEHMHMTVMLSQYPLFVQAISVGAVFFGANTYIGNGPNFMVKSIAEHHGVKCPTFFGYIFCYSLPVLAPIFGLVWFIFFRNVS
jgi:Na+/H+ antiporter NhaD/arsenite permease-like protein